MYEMTSRQSPEGVVERRYSNPIECVIPALERLGLEQDGQYFFCTQAIDSTCDALVLIKQGQIGALSVYSQPVPAIDAANNPATLVRNQTILQDEEGCMVVTGSVRRCDFNGNHADGIEITTAEDLTDETDRTAYEDLLGHLCTLVDSIRLTDLIDETEFKERVKDACPYGDDCP